MEFVNDEIVKHHLVFLCSPLYLRFHETFIYFLINQNTDNEEDLRSSTAYSQKSN